MKIIKSLSLIAVGLFATTLLHGQQTKNENNKPPELKTEKVKPEEPKISATATNKPSPQPESKPQSATEKPVAAEAPKSLVGEEETKPQEKVKPAMKVIDAGKAENQKQGPTTPSTIDPNIKAVPVTKVVVSKTGQKQ